MKKLFYLIMLLFICNNAKADVVLPDSYFKLFLKSKYPSCFYVDANSVEWLNTSCSSITTEDSLDMSDYGYQNNGSGDYPFDLEGIEYFSSLKYLNVKNHAITSTPFLPFSLIYLNFSNTSEYSFSSPLQYGFFPNSLRYLDCSSSFINPNSWPDSLRYLDCSNNWLYALPALPIYLDTLICTGQRSGSPNSTILSGLPDLPSTLTYVDCSNNALTSLPVLPASLKYLDCTGCNTNTNPETVVLTLEMLPSLPDGLEILKCGGNKLTSLPALPSSLKYLYCAYNRHFIDDFNGGVQNPNTILYEGISLLPDLPSSLQYLNCSYNKLTSLPMLPALLTYLDCSYNVYCGRNPVYPYGLLPQTGGIGTLSTLPAQLETLNCALTEIYCIPRIPASLTSLVVDSEKVTCLPNSGNYTVTGGPIPLCTIFNNPNQCPSTSVISGNIFYDLNSNGIKDPGENYRPNVQVQLSNGINAYTNSVGYYELSVDPGTYTLSVISPPFYAAVPSSINYSVNSYDTLIHDYIALQPTASHDSISVSVVPLNTARPGFSHRYKIRYENVGTTIVSASIIFNYDANRLIFVYCSNAAVVSNGASLSLAQANIGPGQVNMFTTEFEVSQTAVPGDTLRADAIITAGTSIATDSCYSVIVASMDPNDKNATPELTPQQVTNGSYINYVIRFQNTGTASAINVVVTDTLSSFLDAASFKMLNASHICRTIRTGNKISFEFLNILLPDSNVEEAASHGYIRFAVRPIGGVALNTVIPNKASIYFDFNAPVVTNIANTTIQLTTVPLTLLSFKVIPDANNNALLYWKTASEFKSKSFDIEQSVDGRTFDLIGNTAARGRGDNTYSYKTIIPAEIVYYRLKMIDIDGMFTYSQFIQVKRNKNAEPIVVLSNPAKNTLSIIISDATFINTSASIINEQGVVVKRFIINDGLQNIDVSNLSTGIYYLKSGTLAKKIMINH